jgi:hypothetical protein
MKKIAVLLFVACVTFCTAASANAETLLTATIPFDFEVRGITLPASNYTIGGSLQASGGNLVFMGDGPTVLARAATLDSRATGEKLVFRKIGDEYFLSDVVTPTGTLHFAPSHKEKDAERVRAANLKSYTTIAVQ